MTDDAVSEGWYPADEHVERYWDGQVWTDKTRPRVSPPPTELEKTPAVSGPTPLVTALVIAAAGVGFIMAMQGASLLTGTGNLWTGVAIAVGASVVSIVVKARTWVKVVVLLAALAALGNTVYIETQLSELSEGFGGLSFSEDEGDKKASSDSEAERPTVKIMDFGLGQAESDAHGIVIVTTDSKSAIGESVTVTANFLDADGEIIATEEQTEGFNWVGQELVLPIWLYLDDKPDLKIASIDPSVTLSDYGTTGVEKEPLPVLEATDVRKAEFGGYMASFNFTNKSDDDLADLRVGIVCFDGASKIVGGTSTYPELAPAGKTIRIDAEPTVSGKPTSCKAYMNYDVA